MPDNRMKMETVTSVGTGAQQLCVCRYLGAKSDPKPPYQLSDRMHVVSVGV